MAKAADNRAKNQKMAADLVARGYWHGRRQSKGLSNVPDLTRNGSAAFRRLEDKQKNRAARHTR